MLFSSSTLDQKLGSAKVSQVDERLAEKGLQIPPVSTPVAAYVPAVRAGGLVFTAGQVPRREGEVLFPGKTGGQVSVEQAREAAKVAALQALAAVGTAVPDLDHVERAVKVTVFVNSAAGFSGQPQVADGASEVFGIAFGPDAGAHARSAVGVSELPLNSCVEVELIVEVRAPG
jgi:enamine deaminase RidA (YjgF/YER057c/UK114 family)